MTEEFGRLVCAARNYKRITGLRLAAKASMSPSYLSAIENGTRIPPENTAARLAMALGCTLPEFEALGRELSRRLA